MFYFFTIPDYESLSTCIYVLIIKVLHGSILLVTAMTNVSKDLHTIQQCLEGLKCDNNP